MRLLSGRQDNGNNLPDYLALLTPVQGRNVSASLENLKRKLKQILIVSLITSIGFAISLILFFTFNISFTAKKYVVLAGLILRLGIMIYFSCKTWIGRIRHMHQASRDFGDNA